VSIASKSPAVMASNSRRLGQVVDVGRPTATASVAETLLGPAPPPKPLPSSNLDRSLPPTNPGQDVADDLEPTTTR
jgi:hypothetical protein